MARRRGRRGAGSIVRRAGRYQAQWSSTEGGKRVRKSATFTLRNDAEWWLRQAQRGTIPNVERTVSEYLDDWLAGKRNVRRSTHDVYSSHVKVHIAPALGHHRVTELEPRHVERFIAGLKVAPGTVGLILRTLRSALQTANRPDNLTLGY